MFMIDFFGNAVRTLMFFSSNKTDSHLKVLSVIASLAFILGFTLEFIYQLLVIPRLATLPDGNLAKLEKALKEKYFDGL